MKADTKGKAMFNDAPGRREPLDGKIEAAKKAMHDEVATWAPKPKPVVYVVKNADFGVERAYSHAGGVVDALTEWLTDPEDTYFKVRVTDGPVSRSRESKPDAG